MAPRRRGAAPPESGSRRQGTSSGPSGTATDEDPAAVADLPDDGAAATTGREAVAPPASDHERLDAEVVPDDPPDLDDLDDSAVIAAVAHDDDDPVEVVAEADEPPGEGMAEVEAEVVAEEPERRRHTVARPAAEASSRSLVRHDPLAAYVQEIRRYALLDREEEHRLAVRYAKSGDVVAARHLVTSNLRLVVKIAHEYQRAYRNLLDLIQEGNIGLMQAVKKYDPYRGVKFSSYAAWWIRAYILKFILNNWRLVKIGTTQAQRKLFFNLRKEKERIERMGIEAGPKLLAERLDVTEREVQEMEQRLGHADVSLDAPLQRDEDGSRTFLDVMHGDHQLRPDEQVAGQELSALLREKLEAFGATLTGREATIFEERLLGDPPATLQEIGERYGISRERARQLEKRLIERIRVQLRHELGDTVDVVLGREE